MPRSPRALQWAAATQLLTSAVLSVLAVPTTGAAHIRLARASPADGANRCGFATTKGPAICTQAGATTGNGRKRPYWRTSGPAMTPTDGLDTHPTCQHARRSRLPGAEPRGRAREGEILRLEREAGHLVRYLGGKSATVRSELQGIESASRGFVWSLPAARRMPSVPSQVHPTWMRAKLERLDDLPRQAPAQAKVELAKQLDGELTLRPRPRPAASAEPRSADGRS
jgi:hypothetical protein